MNLLPLKRLFATSVLLGGVLFPATHAFAEVITNPEETIRNINSTCCACSNSQNGVNGFFTISESSTCANIKDSPTVRGNQPASAFENIRCTVPASCPNPRPASEMYTALNPVVDRTPTAPVEAPRPLVTPTLSVPIPGLVLSSATQQGDNLSVPFLSQYISGIYRYGIGIVGLVSTIMAIYGGFRYLLGSSSGDVKTGKTIMTNAVVGLILAFTSYAIIYTINPGLTALEPLQLRIITRENLIVSEALQSTRVDTSDPNEQTPASSGGTGSATAPTGNCPISVPAQGDFNQPLRRNPRTRAFFDGIGATLTGATIGEKIVQVANAAVQCQVTFDACGATAGAIWALAGVGTRGPACLDAAGHGCWTQEQNGRYTLRELPRSIARPALAFRCPGREPCQGISYEGCMNSTPDAVAHFREVARSSTEARMQGYPDSWANLLQPGDIFHVYNGNDSCGANHAMIFVGWTASGRAQVIQGAYGRVAWASTVCVKAACGNYSPITRIFRPQ